jgi:hypothetical protein
MILVDDFFNKVVNKINSVYFPEVEYFRDNKRCSNVHYLVEKFNNGVIDYGKMIRLVARNCKDSETNINKLISEFIVKWH